MVANAECPNAADEDTAVATIAITDQITRTCSQPHASVKRERSNEVDDPGYRWDTYQISTKLTAPQQHGVIPVVGEPTSGLGQRRTS